MGSRIGSMDVPIASTWSTDHFRVWLLGSSIAAHFEKLSPVCRILGSKED
jgi:hypothetical protein